MRKMAFAVAVALLIVGGGATAVAKDGPKELESNCDAGDLDACVKLGNKFQWGSDNIPKDPARAVLLYQKACDGEFANGCYRLGTMHQRGEGVQKDLTLADSLFEQACNLGDSSGCWAVAGLYDPQDGVLSDTTRWAVFMEKTCDLDFMDGYTCLKLGLAYDIGMWVPKDTDHANELFKKGCLFGNKEACNVIER